MKHKTTHSRFLNSLLRPGVLALVLTVALAADLRAQQQPKITTTTTGAVQSGQTGSQNSQGGPGQSGTNTGAQTQSGSDDDASATLKAMMSGPACTVKIDVSGYACSEADYDQTMYRKLNIPGYNAMLPGQQAYALEHERIAAPKNIWNSLEELRKAALIQLGFTDKDVAEYKTLFKEDPLPPLFDRNNNEAYNTLVAQCRQAQTTVLPRMNIAERLHPDLNTLVAPVDQQACNALHTFASLRHAAKLGPVDQKMGAGNSPQIALAVLPADAQKLPLDKLVDVTLDKLGIDADLRAALKAKPGEADAHLLAKTGLTLDTVQSAFNDLKQQLSHINDHPQPVWLSFKYSENGERIPVVAVQTPTYPAFNPTVSRLDTIGADGNNSCSAGVDVSSRPCSGLPEDVSLYQSLYRESSIPRQDLSRDQVAYYRSIDPSFDPRTHSTVHDPKFGDYDPTIKTITPEYVLMGAQAALELRPDEAAAYETKYGHPMLKQPWDEKDDAQRADFLGKCRAAQKAYISRPVNWKDENDWFRDATFRFPVPDCQQAVDFAKKQSAAYTAEHNTPDASLLDVAKNYALYHFEENIEADKRAQWNKSKYPLLSEFFDRCGSGIKDPLVDEATLLGDALHAIQDNFSGPCSAEHVEAYNEIKKVQTRMRKREAEGGANAKGLGAECYQLFSFGTSTALMGAKMAPAMITAPTPLAPIGAAATSALFALDAAGGAYQQAAMKGATQCEAATNGMAMALITAAFFEGTGKIIGEMTSPLEKEVAEATALDAKEQTGASAEALRAAEIRKMWVHASTSCAQMGSNTVVNAVMNDVMTHEPGAPITQVLGDTVKACVQAAAMSAGMPAAAKKLKAGAQAFAKTRAGRVLTAVGNSISATNRAGQGPQSGDTVELPQHPVRVTFSDGKGKNITVDTMASTWDTAGNPTSVIDPVTGKPIRVDNKSVTVVSTGAKGSARYVVVQNTNTGRWFAQQIGVDGNLMGPILPYPHDAYVATSAVATFGKPKPANGGEPNADSDPQAQRKTAGTEEEPKTGTNEKTPTVDAEADVQPPPEGTPARVAYNKLDGKFTTWLKNLVSHGTVPAASLAEGMTSIEFAMNELYHDDPTGVDLERLEKMVDDPGKQQEEEAWFQKLMTDCGLGKGTAHASATFEEQFPEFAAPSPSSLVCSLDTSGETASN